MRQPRVRFTVRRMMVATAVVGVGLAAMLTFRRLDETRRKFHAYDHDARFLRKTIWLNEKRIEVLRSRASATRGRRPRRRSSRKSFGGWDGPPDIWSV